MYNKIYSNTIWKIELIKQQNYSKISRSTFSIWQTFSFLLVCCWLYEMIANITGLHPSKLLFLYAIENIMYVYIFYMMLFGFALLINITQHTMGLLSIKWFSVYITSNMLASNEMLYVTVVNVRHSYLFIYLFLYVDFFFVEFLFFHIVSARANEWVCVSTTTCCFDRIHNSLTHPPSESTCWCVFSVLFTHTHFHLYMMFVFTCLCTCVCAWTPPFHLRKFSRCTHVAMEKLCYCLLLLLLLLFVISSGDRFSYIWYS